MSGFGSLEILKLMLDNSHRTKPWQVPDFRVLEMSESSIYRYLKMLTGKGLVKKYNAGYMLSPLVLEAGAKYQLSMNRLQNPIKTQEEIYG